MSNKDLHVDRIKPEFSVSESGIISWKASLTDYDASLFHRGKTVTNDEFNTLFLNKTYQNNYLADSLTEFFKTHFPEAVYRTFKSRFNMHNNFVKVFDSTVWGNKQADGYYYITIPASEHGIVQPPDETPLAGMNVDTEMYLLDEATGTFYEVTQVETDVDNTVQLYTDDNTLSGFVIIRSNDKSFALTAGRIDVSQIDGIADVALSNDYRELNFRPDDDIKANRDDIDAMLSKTAPLNGRPFVHNADYATNAENAEYATNLLGSGTIQNQPVSAIFEEGSSYIKNATHASYADYTDLDFTKGTIDDRLNTHTTEITQINEDISLLDARLTNLGFKQGSFIVENQSTSSVDDHGEPYATVLLNISINEIKRQGNYCIANLKVDFVTQANPNYTGGASSVTYSAKVTVPEEFRPKQTVTGYFAGTTEEVATGYVPNYVNIYADGRVTFKYWSYWSGQFVEGDATYSIGSYITNLGWEAVPII